MSDTFRCAQCGGVFPKAWSDEEAMAEAVSFWGVLLLEVQAVVCDDCFNEFMPWMRENHPEVMRAGEA